MTLLAEELAAIEAEGFDLASVGFSDEEFECAACGR